MESGRIEPKAALLFTCLLNKEAAELDQKRGEYIKKELEKKGKGKDSFDSNVLELLRKQAKRADVEY